MAIKTFISKKNKIINQALDNYLPAADLKPSKLHQSMRYSVLAGGKRLRPILTLVAAKLVGDLAEEDVLPAACAVELVHNYSLIHDDLPSMDDDDIRRGQPSNHNKFSPALAILAGDALLTLAFELLSDIKAVDAKKINMITKELAEGAGHQGMVGGQVVDIESEGKEIDSQELDYIHRHKTGALLKTSVRIGALMGGAKSEELTALTTYAEKIGLAFQIVDDILDVEGSSEKLGKAVGSDSNKDKATFPAIYGLSESKELAAETVEEAKEALDIFTDEANILKELADYIIQRDY
ncbi:polyprenyl synthetase family protein [Halanaerobacter jeridensis]|uniref:Farnesyl diphosphate synthase n=1 Tax=Halanaerobacter jeridensis TaxID=706427 RepID=A0A938XPY0_9FIRM|nr:farnesyl diphosphate synthase [Halanaerobacter jeridensis]MBM7555241.1 geranylgeranyl diphosphate synthase type II [Halanaerobacter jeridensis]